MKLIVHTNGTLKSIQEKLLQNIGSNFYVINLSDKFEFSKTTKRGIYKQLSDSDGNLLWDVENDILQPQMGFEVTDENVEINIYEYTKMFSIEEVLEKKYKDKLKSLEKYSNIFYDELIDGWDATHEGHFNVGKKFLVGKGIFEHKFNMKDNKIFFDIEYKNQIPNLEFSIDGNNWTKIKKLPFSRDIRKTTKVKSIQFKLNDFKNPITAYCIAFNGNKIINKSELKGRKII